MADSDHRRVTAEVTILRHLQNHNEISDSFLFAAEAELNHDDIANVIKSLDSHHYVDYQEFMEETWLLSEEAKTCSSWIARNAALRSETLI